MNSSAIEARGLPHVPNFGTTPVRTTTPNQTPYPLSTNGPPSHGPYCLLNPLEMALLGPLKRLILARRPSYKRVSSSGSTRRLSNPPQPDLDDEYDGDDDIVHGGFVYCAFLMLGTAFLQCRLLTLGLAMLLR